MKTFTRVLAALLLAAGSSTMAYAQSVTLSTNSNMDFSKVKETTTSVRLNRYFIEGYNTICLPFSVTSDKLHELMGEGVMLEKLAMAEAGTLTFVDVTSEGIEAGVPYLIYAPATRYVCFSTTDPNLVQTPKVLTIGDASMSGNFDRIQNPNLYGIPAKQDTAPLQAILVPTEGEKTFLPTRCGIMYNGTETPVIAHISSLSNETTAIQALQARNAKVDIYTTTGTLVKKNIGMKDAMNTLTPGIYVVNGMKFMIK